MKADKYTIEEIQHNFNALGDSVAMINKLLAGDTSGEEDDEAIRDCIKRNVEHLTLMISENYWADDFLKAARAAIIAGEAE